MILGALFRLALCALFFYLARYALKPDAFRTMLEDLAERFFKPRDAFAKANDFLPRIVQVLYVFSAIFFLSTCLFVYKNVRQLRVVEDENSRAKPYSTPSTATVPGGANPYAGMAPRGGQQYQQVPGQSYGGQPYGQPYGRQPAGTAQPYGGQPAGGAQPYGGPPAAGTQPVQPGTAQPYGRAPGPPGQ